jgi:hypothetical protein
VAAAAYLGLKLVARSANSVEIEMGGELLVGAARGEGGRRGRRGARLEGSGGRRARGAAFGGRARAGPTPRHLFFQPRRAAL